MYGEAGSRCGRPTGFRSLGHSRSALRVGVKGAGFHTVEYRATSLIRNRHPVGPYNRTMPRLLRRSTSGRSRSALRQDPLRPEHPSFQALSGRLNVTVRPHQFTKDPLSLAGWASGRRVPHGGARTFHQTSTCLTQLAFYPCAVQIWSRNTLESGGAKTAKSTAW